jgi:UDP-N-acetylglucosamine diphosphorylase/glucosamine-1-phosphate N-acetyltransferase
MRAGALLVRERWTRVLGAPVAGQITAPHLAGFEEPGAARVLTTGTLPRGSWLVNARYVPALQPVSDTDALVAGDTLAAIRLSDDVPVSTLVGGLATLGAFAKSPHYLPIAATGWWMREVWDYVEHLVPMLEHDIPVLGAALSRELPRTAIRVGDHPVFIEDGADIEDAVCFDVAAGPVLVSKGAHVQAFTRLVGPLFVGPDSTVTADRIANSSIGDTCKVHGEVSNSIFIGHANKAHDGFLGHSILGRWVNLGAETTTSNLKNTYGTVQLWTPDGVRETGLQFLGTLFGDHAKTGIGLRLTTGTVLGAGANVFGSAMPPKTVAPFMWGETGTFTDYRLDKFLEVAERMMARRHVPLSESSRAQLSASYAARWTAAE